VMGSHTKSELREAAAVLAAAVPGAARDAAAEYAERELGRPRVFDALRDAA
jgi:hypothetical protein